MHQANVEKDIVILEAACVSKINSIVVFNPRASFV